MGTNVEIETSGIITSTGGFVGNLVGIASTAINLANGLANQIPYQEEPGTTKFLPTGTVNQVLTSQGPGQATILATCWICFGY